MVIGGLTWSVQNTYTSVSLKHLGINATNSTHDGMMHVEEAVRRGEEGVKDVKLANLVATLLWAGLVPIRDATWEGRSLFGAKTT